MENKYRVIETERTDDFMEINDYAEKSEVILEPTDCIIATNCFMEELNYQCDRIIEVDNDSDIGASNRDGWVAYILEEKTKMVAHIFWGGEYQYKLALEEVQNER